MKELSDSDIAALREVLTQHSHDEGWDKERLDETLARMVEHIRKASLPPDPRDPEPGKRGVHVYIIAERAGFLKVGISDMPGYRAWTFSAGNPRELYVAYLSRAFNRAHALTVEQSAHDLLADFALGREWFSCSVEQALAAVQQAGGDRQ